MQIEIRMEESCREPKIIIVTDKITDEINALLKKLSSETAPVIAGFTKIRLRSWNRPISSVSMHRQERYLR